MRAFLPSSLLAALALAAFPARADTWVDAFEYPGLSPSMGAAPVSVGVHSDEGGTFTVLLETRPASTTPAQRTVTVARGGSATAAFSLTAPETLGVVEATVTVKKGTSVVESYVHKLVVDSPPVTDAEVLAAGIRTLAGTRIATAQELALAFAPVVRLSTPGPLGNDERFLPKAVEAAFRAARLSRRHPVSGRQMVIAGFDSAPLDVLGRNPGGPALLDLKGALWARDTPDQAFSLQVSNSDVPERAYATVARADGVLTLQYWFFYLYNDWSNDHECDWEQITIAFDGPEGALEPAWIAGSRHQDGVWRTWSKTPKLVDPQKGPTLHPIVFVANGGHGNYFWGGDDPAGPLGNDNHDGTVQELVPAGSEGARPNARTLDVQLVSRLSDRADLATRWLAYSGRWGYWDGSTNFLSSGSQGPGGPAFRQGATPNGSRPTGEMWLRPAYWREHGADGQPLGADAEDPKYANWISHTIDVTLDGAAPQIGGEVTYRCTVTGQGRDGNALTTSGVLRKVVATSPNGRVTGDGSVTVRMTKGGQLDVSCLAAEVVSGRAYAEGSADLRFVACPAATEIANGECRCLSGYTSPDPSRTACTKLPEPERPDAGSPEDAGVWERPDAGPRPPRPTEYGPSSEGCNCTAQGAASGLLSLLAAIALRRRRG